MQGFLGCWVYEMLIKLHGELEENLLPIIKKTVAQKNVSDKGAFPLDTELNLCIRVPRKLGASSVVLRIWKDGENFDDYPLEFTGTEKDCDVYQYLLVLSETFCKGKDGLFFYKFLFLRGVDTQFTDTHNNVDYTLGDDSGAAFRLLIYRNDFSVPKWFAGGVMYQIFVDRFYKGDGDVDSREDAILNSDWEYGIPQYAARPGDPLKNNEFFGGNLWGVAEKLDRLQEMGVTTLYLNPIFQAYSNHKYDTGDYMQVDKMFGGQKAFFNLLKELKQRKMRIILDGVFNHTGDDSRYFNRYGKYDSLGAYQSEFSEYHNWYCFKNFPDVYDSWWGIDILPKLNPNSAECRQFLAGENGVADNYIQQGIDGWRLDVADELSDEFLDLLRSTVKKRSDNEALIIGEVWENAADKIAYGNRRRYFRGQQLDSVMNYPVRNAILAFALHGDAQTFSDILKDLYSSYPTMVCHNLMNSLGTHDTERILTTLSKALPSDISNAELAEFRLSLADRERAITRLKLASVLQFTVFGVPSVYYGDEAGVEGGHDPFCRMPYPWGRENKDLLQHYKMLGKIRAEHSAFKDGEFRILNASDGFILYERKNEMECILVFANATEETIVCSIDRCCRNLFTDEVVEESVEILATSALILKCETND